MTNARTARNSRSEKAAAMRAEVARREARRRSLIITSTIVAVLALVIGVFVVISTAQRDAATAAGSTPRNSASGSITVGQGGAPVALVVYEDFLCPACKQFEVENAAQLSQWISDGTVKVEFRPISFLDRASTDEYSTRALNAAGAVLDLAPNGFTSFHDALFAEQPAEGGPGLSDDRLVDLAVAAGAPRDQVRKLITDRAFEGWTKQVTEAASKAGINGTPTVLVNGTKVENWSAANLKQAVEQAAAAKK
jgi:protein-disulfide isomerase